MTTLDHQVGSHAIPNPSKSLITKLNMGTGTVVGAIFAVVVYYWLRSGEDMTVPQNDNRVLLVSMFAWSVGFLVGIGAFIGPFRWLIGKDLTDEEQLFLAGEGQGISRYFRYCTDHKVVGIQYLVGVMAMLGVGGTLAMMIRTNLAMPGSKLVTPAIYNSLVGLHGITMIVAMIVVSTGPFGNFILPIMIGARDMAFPRLNALSWWVLFTAIPVLCSAWFLGGIPTGWTAYAPLSVQAGPGMNAFVATIIIFAVSTAVAGANITATVVTMRAKGMKWNRVPIFVIGATISVALAIPAFPTFMVSMIMTALDRTVGTTYFDAQFGGSGWLYAHLFWIMGHPEVYVILLPGVAVLMEIVPVFVRKPLFSYNAAILGFSGIAGLSILVWAHHMYMSGWLPMLNGPFMITTEMISIPTGLIFLVILGTLWRGKPWMKLPMLSVYAFLWNMLIGGVTGVYLSDVPADNYLHGSMYVTAHFHYTLMGAALTGAIAGLAYWFPKMTGRMLHEKAGYVAFWFVQIGFQILFLGMFIAGAEGQPRRVADFAAMYKHSDMISTVGAYSVGIGMLFLLWAVIHSWRKGAIAPMNPWGAKTLEWTVPFPVPLENFNTPPVITSDPYGYGRNEK
ncbi:MAG: cbb3-type cytochrome c oxidase subunit I [Actinomycetes bacterium]|jgi:cytochrome c oxidase subunit I